MSEYLLFRLYGPMASWGGIAVGEMRPSDGHPSQSAIAGLLAAALGIRRHQKEPLAALADGYAMAVRVDAPGVLMRDYQTVQTPSATDMKGRPQRCRADQMVIPRHQLNTLLTTREYLCDAVYTVALQAHPTAPHSLQQLQNALMHPCFPLYLGRKSSPLSLPLQASIVDAATLAAAFAQITFGEEAFFKLQGRGWGTHLWKEYGRSEAFYWDKALDEESLEPLMTMVRRDFPLNRRRWQFAEREERTGRAHSSMDQGE